MKKYILSIALLLAVATAGFAQGKSPEDRAKKSVATMEKNLSLTADQKVKIYDATLERYKASDALKAEAGEGNKPDAEKVKALSKTYNAVVKATLTDEQKATAADLKAKAAEAKAAATN